MEPTWGVTTDFLGHVEVQPSLNSAEQTYLTAFSQSRRFARPQGPYFVPHNPAAEYDEPVADHDAYGSTATGQPSLWCDWVPCWDGCCISYNGNEKFYGPTRWLAYLIDHFLAPNAFARESKLGWFSEFTFDHHLNGVIAACQRDTRELYLIRVEDNRVRKQTIVGPDYSDDLRDLLPYEKALDESERLRIRRRRPKRF